MAEILNPGYAVEYICRVVDETGGQESVPETATMAETNLNGKSSGTGGTKSASDASGSKTNVLLNSALNVATPALNGITDGVAGQVIGKGRQILNLTKAIAKGAGLASVIGAAAPLAAWGIGQLISAAQKEKAKNDDIADSIEKTNFQRQIQGLEKINYTRSGLFGKVIVEDYR